MTKDQLLALSNQGWFNIAVAFFLFLVATIISVYFYLRSKKEAKPKCEMASMRLIGLAEQVLPRSIEVIFEGKQIDRLSKTLIYFWNDGSDTMDGEDIVKHDPTRFLFGNESFVLSANVTAVTRTVNSVSVSVDNDNEVLLHFDFLDPGDGARLEIFHTGNSQNPTVQGTIRRIPKGIACLEPSSRFFALPAPRLNRLLRRATMRRFGYFALTLGCVLIATIGLSRQRLLSNTCGPELFNLGLGEGALLLGIGFGALNRTRRRHPPSLDT